MGNRLSLTSLAYISFHILLAIRSSRALEIALDIIIELHSFPMIAFKPMTWHLPLLSFILHSPAASKDFLDESNTSPLSLLFFPKDIHLEIKAAELSLSKLLG